MSNEFLDQYVKDAVRTESRLDKLEIDKEQVLNLFSLFIHVSELLDGLKKQIFYNNNEKIDKELAMRLNSIKILCNLLKPNYCGGIRKNIKNIDPRVFHGALGVMSEAGEIAEAIHKCLLDPNEKIDRINVGEELGDIFWYSAILHDVLDLDWGQGMKNNIDKLKIRYPQKFTEENSAKRNLEKERKELEK